MISLHENRQHLRIVLETAQQELAIKKKTRGELQDSIDRARSLDEQIKSMEFQIKGMESYVNADHERIN